MKGVYLDNSFVNFFVGVIYSIIYNYVYIEFMVDNFEYMYCPMPQWDSELFLLYCIVSAVPMLYYKGERYLASGLSFFIYVLAYIPMLYSTFISEIISVETQISIILSLCIVLIMLFMTDDKYYVKKTWLFPHRMIISFESFEISVVIIIVFVILMEGRDLTIVDFFNNSDLLYDLRLSYGESRTMICSYLICWSKGAFLPLLLICYLKNRLWTKYVLSVFGFIIIYMLDLQKNTLIMPFLMSLVYYATKNELFKRYFQVCVVGFFIVFSLIFVQSKPENASFNIAALFIMRTQCLDSFLFTAYLNFFENHQFTYYTHINIVDFLTDAYPYSDVLGRMVTNGDMNANASFLITDGYAALGALGIFLIGIVVVFLKGALNSISLKYNKEDLLIIMFPATLGALNASVFTAIVTSGFLMIYLCLKYINFRLLMVAK